MQFDLFKIGAQVAPPSNIGRLTQKEKNRSRHHSVVEVAIKYGTDACVVYGVHHSSKDLSGGELHRKRGGAIGMMEGWREVIDEPVRQRVGLAGMQYEDVK